MLRKSVKVILFSSGVLLAALEPGAAWAESDGAPKSKTSSEAAELTSKLRHQEAELERAVGGLTGVGEELEKSRQQVEEAEAHRKDLGRRARRFNRALEEQKEASARSRARLEERVRVVYRGDDVEGLLLMLEGLFGGGDARRSSSATQQATRLLAEGSRSIQDYKDTKQGLQATLRQMEQSKGEYRKAEEERQASVEELRERESELRASIDGLGLKTDAMQERLAQLRAEEEAGSLKRPLATGGRDEVKARDRRSGRDRDDGRDEGDESGREKG